MKIRRILLLMLILALPFSAFAQHYEGTTVALRTLTVTAGNSGILSEINVIPGQAVAAGETLASFREIKVFAERDGVVAFCKGQEGKRVSGEVLQVNPRNAYLIYCSASGAQQKPETTLLKAGEILYVRCTKDGTHRAMGFVEKIDGKEYQLETIGGELYVGETVSLYRNADFSADSKVGTGTVVSADPDVYQAEGTVLRMRVQPGEKVERGQILYSYISGEEQRIVSPVAGIIEQVLVQEGSSANTGDAVVTLIPESEIGISFSLEEKDLNGLEKNSPATYTLKRDGEDIHWKAMVKSISGQAEDGKYTVLLRPETSPGAVGLTADVNVE